MAFIWLLVTLLSFSLDAYFSIRILFGSIVLALFLGQSGV